MCDACAADPLTHSFDPITVFKHAHVFYTTFKGIKDYTDTESIYRHFKGALDKLGGAPWTWIIDCRFLSGKHLVHINTSLTILSKLQSQYCSSIQSIYLINTGPVLKTMFQAFTPFITKEFANNIVKLNGSPLELFEAFKKIGWTVQEVQPLIHRLQKEFE